MPQNTSFENNTSDLGLFHSVDEISSFQTKVPLYNRRNGALSVQVIRPFRRLSKKIPISAISGTRFAVNHATTGSNGNNVAVDYINTLGAGAGFNTKELVSALVEAERAPKQALIQSKIGSAEAKVSALATAVSELSKLRDAARTLNDQTDFNAFSVSNSLSSNLAATVTSTANAGSHSVTISSLATAQRSTTGNLGAKDSTLNGGNAFNVSLVIGGVTSTIQVTTATPEGTVAAINAANLSVGAELIDAGTSGSNFFIKLTGQTGADNAFTPSSDPNSVLSFSTQQSAANASFTVDGTTFARSGNSVNDVIPGVTLDLLASTSGSTASISISRDNATVKNKISSFVENYNTVRSKLNLLSNAEQGGAMRSDSVFKSIQRSIHNLVLNNASTPGTTVKRFSDIGITVDKTGQLIVDDSVLDTALKTSLPEVVTIFTGDTEKDNEVGIKNRGIAGDLSKLIADKVGSTGYFTTQSESLSNQISNYGEDLEALEVRLENLSTRYTRQFLTMQQVIDSMNNTKDNLISTFENLPYTRKN